MWKPCKQMTRDELRDHIRTLALRIAMERHRQLLPDAGDDDAWAYAWRNWERFKEPAFTLAACLDLTAGQVAQGESFPPVDPFTRRDP